MAKKGGNPFPPQKYYRFKSFDGDIVNFFIGSWLWDDAVEITKELKRDGFDVRVRKSGRRNSYGEVDLHYSIRKGRPVYGRVYICNVRAMEYTKLDEIDVDVRTIGIIDDDFYRPYKIMKKRGRSYTELATVRAISRAEALHKFWEGVLRGAYAFNIMQLQGKKLYCLRWDDTNWAEEPIGVPPPLVMTAVARAVHATSTS